MGVDKICYRGIGRPCHFRGAVLVSMILRRAKEATSRLCKGAPGNRWNVWESICGFENVLSPSRQSFGNVGVAFEIAGGYMFAQPSLK